MEVAGTRGQPALLKALQYVADSSDKMPLFTIRYNFQHI